MFFSISAIPKVPILLIMSSPRTVYLTPPQLSDLHIKERIVCIRAHRERIFQTSISWSNKKMICSNYGQGGAGWTFLFGSVREMIHIFELERQRLEISKSEPIVVVGAGCYGLLSAILLTLEGYTVSIIAKELHEIASYKAAGFFFPRPRRTSTSAEIETFARIGIASYQEYLSIICGTHPFLKRGAKIVPAYYDHAIDPGFGQYSAQGIMPLPQAVRVDFGNGMRYELNEFHTVFIDVFAMMSDLHRMVDTLSISTTQREISGFDELSESIVFNCTSLGSKALLQDKGIIPVQGHLIALQNQPDLSQLNYMINVRVEGVNERGIPRNDLIYYAPKESGILGITFLRGQDSLHTNHHEFDRMLARCRKFFGS